jgi:DNA polymerase III subunit epsilon
MAYVVLDFETTGLDYLTEQVIEIGAVKLDAQFNEIGTFHTMVKLTEGRHLSKFIQDYTGIKEEDLYDGLSEVVALNTLKDFIGNAVVVAQHAPFDLAFLAKAYEPELFIDTRSVSRLLNPDEKAGLKDLVERYGVELNGHHRSMNDVKATIEVFKIMMQETLQRGLPVYNVIVKQPDRDLNFIPLSAVVLGLDAYKNNLKEAEEAAAAKQDSEK